MGLGNSIVSRITEMMLTAVGAIIRFVTTYLFDEALSPSLDWLLTPSGPYAKAMTVGIMLTFAAVAFAVIQGVIKGAGFIALKSVTLDLMIAIFGMVFGVTLVQQLIMISDEMSAYFLSDSEAQIEGFLAWVSDATADKAAEAGFFVVVLAGILTIVAGLMLAILLFAREFLIYLLVALLPFYFALAVWPALRGAVRLGIQITVGLVFSKVAIALAIMVGTWMLGGYFNAPVPANGWQPGQFAFLDQGTFVFQGTQVVFKDDRPLRVPNWYTNAEATRSFYLACFSPDRVIARGENIDFVDEFTGAWTAPLGGTVRSCGRPSQYRVGGRVDPDAEKYNRYVIPYTKDRALLQVLPEETARSGEGGTRVIVLDDSFQTWDLFDSLNYENIDEPAEEITPDMAASLNPRFQNALSEAFGYDSQGQPLPGRGCQMYEAPPDLDYSGWLGDIIEMIVRMAYETRSTRDCAIIDTEGNVLVNRQQIGVVENNQVENVDFGVIAAGAALMMMAAFAPFILIRLLPIVEAAVLIEGASAAAKSPLQRGANFANPVNNLKNLAAGNGQASPGPTSGGGGPGPGNVAAPAAKPASSGSPGAALARKG